jgi:acyl-CoA reductase-like NAD-dependent aldehyde dehydrogenase
MNLARVRGTVVATRRSDKIDGAKWLLVEECDQAGTTVFPSAAEEQVMAEAADDIRQIVEQVLLGAADAGVFADVDSAVKASAAAQRELTALPLSTRTRMIDSMRRAVIGNYESLSRDAVAETGLGNLRDKQVKNTLAAEKTPGVEDVQPSAFSDERGLTLTERAPHGVIGAITPVTNPIATITSNSIGMIAAGNSVVFNVHPNAKRASNRLVVLLNEAIRSEGGPQNLLCAVADPTIESAGALMKHPGISILVVTASPGNPPCVVEPTSDIVKAGRDIVAGSSFDNNVVCICEKEVLAVEVEHGFRHTAMIHSHNIEKLSRMAKVMNCSLFVKNGPCYAGLGQGGAGFTSFTIASPTGEGITRARTFTRERRCTLVDSFRII